MSDAFWQQKYEAGQTGWERGAANPAFLAWRAGGTLTQGRVLLPCAGRSPEPALLAAEGFDVTVLDIAPAAVAAQRAMLGDRGAVIEADLFTWTAPAPFDAIYDQTALCALPPARHGEYEALLHRWLRPGGRLLILFAQTGRPGGPPFDCPIDQMRGLFAAPRWRWPERLETPVRHPNGMVEQPAVLDRVA